MTKANQNARSNFVRDYSRTTLGILLDLSHNRSVKTITKTRKVKASTVAAVKANLTRNTYSPYASKDKLGMYGTMLVS